MFTLGVPLGVVATITRARLYEIDRFITRTVTYGAVTAVLVVVYAVVAVVPSVVLELESDLLVAAATLAAAVFVPARRWVQTAVDRRFNRARYDAQQVVARFGSQLRGDIHVDRLHSEIAQVVTVTVQPAHVSLWVRRPPEVR